jgi:hypothetical protein
MRLIHRLKHRWNTRHWNRRHFPGCPVRYGTGTECISPELLCAKQRRKVRTMYRRLQHRWFTWLNFKPHWWDRYLK